MTNFALIGDVHSIAHLLGDALNYCQEHNLTPILLGDLFDSRCGTSDSVGVYNLVRDAQKNLNAVILHSNHQDKLVRYLKGNKVNTNNGLDLTLNDFNNSNISNDELLEFLISLPYGMAFKDHNNVEYRASHAFFSGRIEVPEYDEQHFVYENDLHRKLRNVMIYGPTNDKGRIYWWEEYRPRDFVRVSGHYHTVHIDDMSLVIDGECGEAKETAFLPLYDINKKLLKKFS